MCQMCEKRGKTWQGSDPECAFDSKGMLKPQGENWNCATIGEFRSIAHSGDYDGFDKHGFKISVHWGSEDESGMMISYEGTFVFLQWYKNRGRTAFIKVLNGYKESDEAELLYLLESFKSIQLKLKVSKSNKQDAKTYKGRGFMVHKDINSCYPRLMVNSIYGITLDPSEAHNLGDKIKRGKEK